MNYLDFDLLIERTGDKYKARVFKSPVGEAVADFNLPFKNGELDDFILQVGRPRAARRHKKALKIEGIAKAFGGKLFSAVFNDDIHACFRSSLDEATRQSAGLRLRLRLAEVPELANIPWEYLHEPKKDRFLCLSQQTPIVRYLEIPERIRSLPVDSALRILVMISSPADHPALDVEQEWDKLNDALREVKKHRLVELDRLDDATWLGLQTKLREAEYHIFHFIGHGGFDQQTNDGVLIFEGENNQGQAISGQKLGTLLHDEQTLRLAFLNACEGARSGRRDPFAGVAQSLVQQGIPAVIAMQFEVTDEAAITLTHQFYAALADGYSVDAALAEARKAMFGCESNNIEWGTPVLYMRAPDGQIFNLVKTASVSSPFGARLVVRKGVLEAGKVFVLAPGTRIIGRENEQAVFLPDSEVSRHHAKITGQGNQYIIEDLGSTNGTRLNDKQISEPQALRDGDLIGVGQNLLVFQLQSDKPVAQNNHNGRSTDTDMRLSPITATKTFDLR